MDEYEYGNFSLDEGQGVQNLSEFFSGGDNALSGIDLLGLGTDFQELDLSGLLNLNSGVDLAGLNLGPEAFDISSFLAGGKEIDFSQILGDFGEKLGIDTTGMDAGEGAFDVSSFLGGKNTAGLPEKANTRSLSNKADTRGYYDETSATGEFISDPLGGLTGELTNETSGTNADSMKGYTYDKATGTWTTPTGEVYKPDKAPSNTVKSGAQVMVDAGALPRGYAGLAPTKGSTADIKSGKDGVVGKTGPAGIAGKAGAAAKKDSNSGMLMALLALMAMMNKGGGGSSSPSAVIPSLLADRRQLPYGGASGARPGAGGVNYFSPTTYTQRAAGGGMMYGGGGISDLGGYSDGGRLLRGPGDGVSDSIPATIGGKQPARLAEGEFVVPARIVSELGNGSTEAGAKKLYAMMDRVQNARRKTKNVAADTKARKYLPA